MAVFFERVDPAPLQSEKFSFDFESWLSNLVDQLNEQISDIQNQFNGLSDGLVIPQKTTAEINALAVTAANGTMWYATDSIPPNIVIKINGALRQVDHSAFP